MILRSSYTLIALAFALASSGYARPSRLLEWDRARQRLVVSQGTSRHWYVSERLCVMRGEVQLACGTVVASFAKHAEISVERLRSWEPSPIEADMPAGARRFAAILHSPFRFGDRVEEMELPKADDTSLDDERALFAEAPKPIVKRAARKESRAVRARVARRPKIEIEEAPLSKPAAEVEAPEAPIAALATAPVLSTSVNHVSGLPLTALPTERPRFDGLDQPVPAAPAKTMIGEDDHEIAFAPSEEPERTGFTQSGDAGFKKIILAEREVAHTDVSARSQASADTATDLKNSLIGIGLNYLFPYLHYQRGISENLALGIELMFLNYQASSVASFIGGGSLASLNYYSQGAFEGMWVHLAGGAHSLDYRLNGGSQIALTPAVVVQLGWRWAFAQGSTFGFCVGAQALLRSADRLPGQFSGFLPAMGMELGIRL